MPPRLGLPCLLACLACCAGPNDAERKPHPLNNAKLVYPEVAALHGRGGKVELDCTITETGVATDCLATRGDNDFKTAALSYMRAARYAPALRNGVPVAFAHFTVGITFKTPAPRPITLPVDCDVSAAGKVRNCRAKMATPPQTWPVIKSMAEAETLAPGQAGGHAVDDPARTMLLSFAFVWLPWFGPAARLEGEPVLTAQFSCVRQMPRPHVAAVTCTPEAQTDTLPEWDARDHMRAWLGIKNGAPAATGDFGR